MVYQLPIELRNHIKDLDMKFISRVVLPLILFVYIAVEGVLKLQKSSLCHSTGCELAEELLRFDSLQLYAVGAIGALLIAVLGYASTKRESFTKLFFITLFSAVAFESIMIGYQVFVNPEPCKFCMGVYGLLLLTALLSSWRYLLYALPMIAAIFISLGSLAIPKNQAIVGANGYYIIKSDSCPHCIKVKNFMEEEHISYTTIDPSDTTARSFMTDMNITQIPVLIVKENSRIQIIKGDKIIIEHIKNSQKDTSSQNDKNKNDIYSQEAKGCEASAELTQEAGCAEESILQKQNSIY